MACPKWARGLKLINDCHLSPFSFCKHTDTHTPQCSSDQFKISVARYCSFALDGAAMFCFFSPLSFSLSFCVSWLGFVRPESDLFCRPKCMRLLFFFFCRCERVYSGMRMCRQGQSKWRCIISNYSEHGHRGSLARQSYHLRGCFVRVRSVA